MADRDTPPLLSCPIEILHRIFYYLLPYTITFDEHLPEDQKIHEWEARSGFIGIFSANRIISDRALEYLYGENTFTLDTTTLSPPVSLGPNGYFEYLALRDPGVVHPVGIYSKIMQADTMMPRHASRMRKIRVNLRFEWHECFSSCGLGTHCGQHRRIALLLEQVFKVREVLEQCVELVYLEIRLSLSMGFHQGLCGCDPGMQRKWILGPIKHVLSLLRLSRIARFQVKSHGRIQYPERFLDVLRLITPQLENQPALGTAMTFNLPRAVQKLVWEFMLPHSIGPGELSEIDQGHSGMDTILSHESPASVPPVLGREVIFARTIVSNPFIAHLYIRSIAGFKWCHLRYQEHGLYPGNHPRRACPSIFDFGYSKGMLSFNKIRIDIEVQDVGGAVQASANAAVFLNLVLLKGIVTIKYTFSNGVILNGHPGSVHQILEPLWHWQTGVRSCKKVRIRGLANRNPGAVWALKQFMETYP
ncbi:MAG: hypothetical protein Q9157_003518 [Trypethelium eluteriae]